MMKLWMTTIQINSKNLYSTSYYYHKEKDRYYKYLLYSLERKNLNHFFGNPFYQESNIVFKDINWQPIYDWLKYYKLYTLEIQTFYNLLHNINE